MSEQDNILKKSLLKSDSVKEIKPWQMPNVGQGKKVNSLTTVTPDYFEIEKRARMQMLENERKQGFNAGYMSGQEQGKEEGKKAYEAKITKVEALLNQMDASLKEVDDIIASHVLELVVAVSKQVVGKELSLSHDSLLALVNKSLKYLPKNSKGIRLHLHPEDKSLVEAHIRKECFDHIEHMEIIADERIEPGGCIVQSDSSFIDQTIEARLRETLEALQEGYEHSLPADKDQSDDEQHS